VNAVVPHSIRWCDYSSRLAFKDYIKLQTVCKSSLTDSGTINEESSILNFPALKLREALMTPRGMEESAVMMVRLGSSRIMQGFSLY